MTGEGMERAHGGDWAGYEKEYGRLPLDFSANISPLGMPESVREAAAASLAGADRYPDPSCRVLRRGLAERYAIPEESVLCGAGAADLLDRLALALRPKTALIPVPAFTEYRMVLERFGCRVRTVPLPEAEDFRLGPWFLEEITPGLDMVILCEPNNPTGLLTDRALLDRIAERCGAAGALLVMDECFNEFLEEPDGHSLLGEAGRQNVLVLRAFTKFYGLAGLRLGWCACGDRELLARMAAAGQPWPVSVPAQAAGLAALEERDYGIRLRALIREERPQMKAALEALGCRVIPGEANFLLFRDPCPDLSGKLAARGILLRSCGDFEGLGPGWYRTAVRTPEENGALIEAMKEAHG